MSAVVSVPRLTPAAQIEHRVIAIECAILARLTQVAAPLLRIWPALVVSISRHFSEITVSNLHHWQGSQLAWNSLYLNVP